MKHFTLLAAGFVMAACSSAKLSQPNNRTEHTSTVSLPDSAALKAPPVAVDSGTPKPAAWNSSPRLTIPAAALPSPPPPTASPAVAPLAPVSNARELKRLDSLVTHLQGQVKKDSIRLAARLANLPRQPRQRPEPAATIQQAVSGPPRAKNLAEAALRLKLNDPVPPKPTPSYWERNNNTIFSGAMISLALIFFTFLFTKNHYEQHGQA